MGDPDASTVRANDEAARIAEVRDPVAILIRVRDRKTGRKRNAILIPRNTWKNKKRYDEMARELGALFRENFKDFEDRVSAEVIAAQPTDK